MDAVKTLDTPELVAAATHPSRAALLAVMRTPSTAAAAGRATGLSRQNAAYHVRALADAGLLRHVDERQHGSFREQIYEAVARAFVVPARGAAAVDERTRAIADRTSLGTLIDVGEELARDATVLLDRAVFDGVETPSAAARTEIRFADADARAAFLRDYLDAVARLAAEHGASTGEAFRVLVAAYPDPNEEAP
jgi:hypothetical protein